MSEIPMLASASAVIRSKWPFDQFRAEPGSWNSHFGLRGAQAFSEDVNPVWWVGRAAKRARFLGIGTNPRRNTGKEWSVELAEIRTSNVDHYLANRAKYFVRGSFNGRHYLRTAQLLAANAGLPEPADSAGAAYFLDDYFVQIEMVPFFSEEFGLTVEQTDELRLKSLACQTSDEILAILLSHHWDCVVVRGLKTAWPTVLRRFGAEETGAKYPVGAFAHVNIGGRSTPLIGLTNNRCSTDGVRDLARAARLTG